MQVDTFQCYKDFVAIKLHFTGSYDFFKYNGKTRANWKSFEKFNGKKILHGLAKKYKDEFKQFIACGFAYFPDISWIGDFNSNDVEAAWLKHNKVMQSIGYTYKNELENVLNSYTIREFLVGSDPHDLPPIFKKTNLTSIEVQCILDTIFAFTSKNGCDHPLWEKKATVIRKYTPFLNINRSKFVETTKGAMA